MEVSKQFHGKWPSHASQCVGRRDDSALSIRSKTPGSFITNAKKFLKNAKNVVNHMNSCKQTILVWRMKQLREGANLRNVLLSATLVD